MKHRGLIAAAAILASMRFGGAADCPATLHKLSHTPRHSDLVLELPVGVAVVAAESDIYAMAAAYRAGAKPGSGKRSILAVGPLLDSPDELRIEECRLDGRRILVRILHTSARLRGAPLRRNIPFRPLVEIPARFEPGVYSVEVRWQAVDALEGGKTLAAEVVTGSVRITL